MECATQVKARLVKYGRAEGVEKTLEMTGESGIPAKPGTDSGDFLSATSSGVFCRVSITKSG